MSPRTPGKSVLGRAYRYVVRPGLALLFQVLLLLAMYYSGVAGYSRWLADRAMEEGQISLADKAVALSPSDPETHIARAGTLWKSGNAPAALAEYAQAAALRPREYYTWMRLAYFRDYVNDDLGALDALKEAVRRAPYYAHPRWALGKTLLELGQVDEGFAELRRAVSSDPSYIYELINLAWETYDGDVRAIEQADQHQSPSSRLALAFSCIQHDRPSEPMGYFRTVGEAAEEDRRDFLAELLSRERFSEAYEVWSGRWNESDGVGLMVNGSFEGEITTGNIGFGWRFTQKTESIAFSLDTSESRTGARSLRIDFDGNFNSSDPILSQLLLVMPDSHYVLSFSARTRDLITGGLPAVIVTDGTVRRQLLAQAPPLSQNTTDWQDYKVKFTTQKGAKAVLVTVTRQSCTSEPCPIFGHLWLDDFSLRKL